MSKLFFVSWRSYVEDYRPINKLPTPPILGWWVIGCGADTTDDYHKMGAYIVANNADQVYFHIVKNWPEFDLNHVDSIKETNKILRHSKFPLTDWMQERINQYERT